MYWMFYCLFRFEQFKFRPPRFKLSSVRRHKILVPPSKCVDRTISATVGEFSITTAVDMDLLLIITSSTDEISGGTNIHDLEIRR